MKKISKRLFGAMLAIIMVVSIAPAGVFNASATPAAQSDYVTGDIFTYGSYPQSKVTDAALITNLNAQTLQPDNTVTYGGSKYKRVFFTQYTPYYVGITGTEINSYQDDNGYFINTVYWFKFEPLQWRVLSNTNGELFVMAEKLLDSKAYNQAYTSVTWETCTLRTWLNNDFYSTAFSSAEQAAIETSAIVNEDNSLNDTDGGNNTSDKLFLLSSSEALSTAYGFDSNPNTSDTARKAQGTDFSKSSGLFVTADSPYSGNSNWCLRSPGWDQKYIRIVNIDGYFVDSMNVHLTYGGIRPAFKINRTSIIPTSIKIAADNYTPAFGSTFTVSADFSSSTLAFDSGTVSYSFSDPSAFSVSGGMTFTGTASSGTASINVTALKAGHYTVTFSTTDGASSTGTIDVQGTVNITKGGILLGDTLKIKIPWYTLYKNSKNDIQLGITPAPGAGETAVWSSDNPGKVQVDQTGKVKNLDFFARSANITVKLLDSNNNVLATDSVKIVFYRFDYEPIIQLLLKILDMFLTG